MAATVTNTNIDDRAALIDAPYGPLTRVTDVATLPTPNSNIRLEFTDQFSNHVWFTYEELADEDVVEAKLQDKDGISGKVQKLKVQIASLYSSSNAMSLPHTRADYDTLMDKLRAIVEVKGLY